MNSRLILAFMVAALLTFSPAYGEEGVVFYSVSEIPNVTPGSEFDVKILVDSREPLNTYEFALRYSPEVLEVVRLNSANSIIDVWQTQPVVYEGGRIRWSGGSFKAFSGTAGEILRITFKTLKVGEAAIAFEKADAYIADGKGTQAASASRELRLAVRAGSPLAASPFVDASPPEIQTVTLEKDPFNPNQNLLSVLAKDTGSGVKEMEARYRTYLAWSEWQPIRNPVAFPPNVWAVNVRVRDNVGNQTAQIIYQWPVFMKNFLPIILIAAALAFLIFKFRPRPR